MIKVIQSIIFILLLSSCHQGSSYVSRYGQSIVLNPNETQSISGNTETISDQKLTSLIKPNVKANKIKTYGIDFEAFRRFRAFGAVGSRAGDFII